MRVMVLGGTRFIGAAVVEELYAHGHELLVVHRGEHEPADLPEVDDLHADRQDLPHLRGPVDEFDPEAVVDNCAYSAADAETALAAIGDDARLLVVSSMDVYRALGRCWPGPRPTPCLVDETSPVRAERYPYRGRPHPSPDTDTYEKLDVEAAYLAREATVCRLPMVYGERDHQRREEPILRRSGPAGAHPRRVGQLAVDLRLRPRRRRRHPPGPGVRRMRGRDPQPGRGPYLVDGPWARHVLEAAGSEAELARVPTSSSPTTWRPSAPSPSTSWWTPARPATCWAGPRPTPTMPSTARSPGTWPTRRRTRTPTSPPTTAPWRRPGSQPATGSSTTGLDDWPATPGPRTARRSSGSRATSCRRGTQPG